jgi:hypothetical protein
MSWLDWLFVGGGAAIVVVLVAWVRLGGLSRARHEDAGLRILKWDAWVNEALDVANDRDPAPRLRRHR